MLMAIAAARGASWRDWPTHMCRYQHLGLAKRSRGKRGGTQVNNIIFILQVHARMACLRDPGIQVQGEKNDRD